MNIDISLRVASWQPTVPIHYVQYSTEIPIVFHIEDYEIPEGARGLNFEPANFGISGTVEFKDIKLTVQEFR